MSYGIGRSRNSEKRLVSYWSFDRPTIKTKVQDLAGKNSGRIEGNKKIVKGLVKEALEFDGKKSYVDFGAAFEKDVLAAVRNGRLPYG